MLRGMWNSLPNAGLTDSIFGQQQDGFVGQVAPTGAARPAPFVVDANGNVRGEGMWAPVGAFNGTNAGAHAAATRIAAEVRRRNARRIASELYAQRLMRNHALQMSSSSDEPEPEGSLLEDVSKAASQLAFAVTPSVIQNATALALGSYDPALLRHRSALALPGASPQKV